MIETQIISNEIYKNPNLDLYKKLPSAIEKNDLNQSLSESSIQSYNIYTNLIPGKKNENDIISKKQNDNIKVLKSHLLIKKDKQKNNNFNFAHNYNSNSSKNIKERIKELKESSIGKNDLKTDRYFINSIYREKNIFKSKKSSSVLMTRMDRMKYGNIISIPNSNILQKKVKKMLNNLKSDEIRKNDDIQDFKNQFENSKKKSPFGIVDFQKKFKSNYNTPKQIRYNHFLHKNYGYISLRTNSSKNGKLNF